MALTKNDIMQIQEMLDNQAKLFFRFVDNTIEAAKTELKDDLESQISHLPTKEEYFSGMDALMGEIKAIREEHPIMQEQISRNTADIENLKDIHPHNKHHYT